MGFFSSDLGSQSINHSSALTSQDPCRSSLVLLTMPRTEPRFQLALDHTPPESLGELYPHHIMTRHWATGQTCVHSFAMGCITLH